jgi:hypothetical protein
MTRKLGGGGDFLSLFCTVFPGICLRGIIADANGTELNLNVEKKICAE